MLLGNFIDSLMQLLDHLIVLLRETRELIRYAFLRRQVTVLQLGQLIRIRLNPLTEVLVNFLCMIDPMFDGINLDSDLVNCHIFRFLHYYALQALKRLQCHQLIHLFHAFFHIFKCWPVSNSSFDL